MDINNYYIKNDFQYNFRKPTSILLGITNQCQLSCNYCFVQQNEENMSLEIAEQALQWLKADNEGNELSVAFFGGEPLLQFNNLIKPLVEKYKSEFNWSITTNGVLLDEDVVDFLYQNHITPLLSFDGVAEVQDKQRSNSFNQVLRNIPYLLLRFPDVTMRSTVTKDSLPFLYDTVLMAEELGFKNIFFCENAFESWGVDEFQILQEQLNKINVHIYQNLLQGKNIIKIEPIIRIFSSITKLLKQQLYFDNTLNRCGLGTISCGITPKGDIVTCQEKISNPDNNIIGNVFTGIDKILHENFLKQYYFNINNILTCDHNCADKTKFICLSHLCPSRLQDLNYNISHATCVFNKALIKTVLKLYFLCANSSNVNIMEYFNQEMIINE